MGWPVSKCLHRAGIPVITMFFGFTLVEIVREKSAAGEAIASNSAIFGMLWIAVSAFFWVLTRIMPETP